MKRFRRWRRKRGKGRWSDYRFILLIILGIFALCLGLIGFTKNSISTGANRSFLDNLYLMLGLLSMNSGSVAGSVSWELQVARFLVPFLTASTALLALAAVFAQQFQHIRVWFIQDHIIICGLGEKGLRLASQFIKLGENVLILEADESNPSVEAMRSLGGLVFTGDATNPDLLQKVRLNRAKYLISVIGDEGLNAAVAVQARKLSSNRDSGRLTCAIHIVDPHLWHLLRQNELTNDIGANFRLEMFNIFDRGANNLLKTYSPQIKTEEGQYLEPHFVLVGLGDLGQALVVQSALQWCEKRPEADLNLRMTIIDLNANKKIEALRERNPFLNEVCLFNAIDMNVLSVDFLRAEFLYRNNLIDDIDTIFICMDNDSLSLKTGLILQEKIKDQSIPLIVRMVNETGLTSLINNNDKKRKNNGVLVAFPLLDETCTPDLIINGTHEVLSRELYYSYMQGINGEDKTEENVSIMPTWAELDEHSKDLNRAQADRICTILEEEGYWLSPLSNWGAAMGFFSQKNGEVVEALACKEHQLWSQELLSAGWKYGEKKSKKYKTNPALIEWEKLPKKEKNKNIKFISDLPKILAKAGFQIDQ